MRIISGVAKGRPLISPKSAARPTSDRAREALFSSLESKFGSLEGLHLLDLFSGSGAICAEALSRGVAIGDAVENDGTAIAVIKDNIELVTKNYQNVGTGHAYHCGVKKFLEAPPRRDYDVIFMDPPYEFHNDEIATLLRLIIENGVLHHHGIVIVERASKEADFAWPEGYIQVKVRSYGAGSLHYGELAK